VNALAESLWRLLPVSAEDIPEILGVETRAYEFPWTEGIFRDCLKAGYSAWAVRGAGGDLQAYAFMTMAVGEAHVLNLCVEPSLRRQGLARFLLMHLLRVARAANVTLVLLEVRRSNKAAIRLYQDFGFQNIGLRKNYYPARDGREDAFVFALDLV
jgi:ribosomal-protein-alanine N-acetyltransferase